MRTNKATDIGEPISSGLGSSGLDGVVVANTRLSSVNGARGELIIAGHTVEQLAATASFEAVCHLLWKGCWPSEAEEKDLTRRLSAVRAQTYEIVQSMPASLMLNDGMNALRASLALLELDESVDDLALLTGATAVFVSAWWRVHNDLSPIAPSSAEHVHDYLNMIGLDATPAQCAALTSYFVTVIDHGMNASTFAARVVASTGSDLGSAIVAAVGALKGPLHGGAPGPVLTMLDAIGRSERAVPYIEAELKAGQRIMGMGHRIYRVRDPRAHALEQATRRLEEAGVHSKYLDLARAVEKAAEGVLRERYPERPLHANVEFYTAVLLQCVGIAPALFSPTFAAARVAGWCAHVAEQRQTGRLIRPDSRYIGPSAHS